MKDILFHNEIFRFIELIFLSLLYRYMAPSQTQPYLQPIVYVEE